MKLSISNIAWDEQHDLEMYSYLHDNGFVGLEIAPTRIYQENPYDKLSQASEFAKKMYEKNGLYISSMQSIWYGKSECVFGTKEERESLIAYTKKAIDFAEAVRCENLVFGSPKNRNKPDGISEEIEMEFFATLGDYASSKNTVLAIEPNPTIYHTNYVNTTDEAFALVKKIGSKGIKVNVDLGTVIYNQESFDVLEENMELINHVHISEPYLERIQERKEHEELFNILVKYHYDRFVSIEMKNNQDIAAVKRTISYVKSMFR